MPSEFTASEAEFTAARRNSLQTAKAAASAMLPAAGAEDSEVSKASEAAAGAAQAVVAAAEALKKAEATAVAVEAAVATEAAVALQLAVAQRRGTKADGARADFIRRGAALEAQHHEVLEWHGESNTVLQSVMHIN